MTAKRGCANLVLETDEPVASAIVHGRHESVAERQQAYFLVVLSRVSGTLCGVDLFLKSRLIEKGLVNENERLD